MKQLKKTGMVLPIIGMMVFASCFPPGPVPPGSEVDFWSYNHPNAAFFVVNNTRKELVAFMGSVHLNNLLGGIPAGAWHHGIRRNPALFNRTQAFSVVLVTYSDFVAHRNNLNVLNNAPFTRIFVFYSYGADSHRRYVINEVPGGLNRLHVNNTTSLGVDLRIGGPRGSSIRYVPSGTMGILPIADGEFFIFPAFKGFDPSRNVVFEIFPTFSWNGAPWHTAIFTPDGPPTTHSLDLVDAMASSLTLGAAWLVFDNLTALPMQVRHGWTILADTIGFSTINPNQRVTIPIDMLVAGPAWASEKTVSGFAVGAFGITGITMPVTDAGGNDEFTVRADWQYTVTVTGSHIDGTLRAVIDLENAVQIDIGDFF